MAEDATGTAEATGQQETAAPNLLAETTKADAAEGEKPAGAEATADEGQTTEAVSYDGLTFPEGAKVDEAVLARFKEVAGTHKLSAEAAQALVDLQGEINQQIAEAGQQQWATLATDWADQTKKDTEIGGQNLKQTVAHAQLALRQFGNAELEGALNQFHLGNHPEIIRFLAKVGKELGDDALVSGNPKGNAQSVPPERAMYPSMFKT